MTERRLLVAILPALGVHVAFAAAAFSTSVLGHRQRVAVTSNVPAIEVALLDENWIRERSHAPEESAAPAGATPPLAIAHAAPGPSDESRRSATPPVSAESATPSDPMDYAAGSASDAPAVATTEASSTKAPAKIDLGLDGSIFRAEVLQAARRPAVVRAPLVHDDWSAVAVRVAAEQAAPREGSALLTLEWDADGQLRTIFTSGHSSDAPSWQKLVNALRRTLSERPKRSAEYRGLRAVYQVKSELIVPHHQRSVIPRLKYGSFEKIEDEQLPPAVTLNFGVKADTSIPAERVVSVTLTSSAVL